MGNVATESNNECNVLVVDDSFLMRSTLIKILNEDSRITNIVEAIDGLDAIDKLKENKFKLVLLDIEMPNMDGIEFMKRCKIYTDAKIIIISSLARINSPQVEKAVIFGAFDVIAKPSGILSVGMEKAKHDELLEVVDKALS